MKIEGSHRLEMAPDDAYRLLQQPGVLSRCIPGCDRLEPTGVDAYAMKMKLTFAAVSGQFDGTVRIADQDPPSSFRLQVDGSGKIGFMKGDGLLRLSAENGGTRVDFSGDVQIGGLIAGVGQRLIDSTARLLIKKFFDKVNAEATRSEGE